MTAYGADSLSPSCQSRRLTTILMVLSRRPLIPGKETKCRRARYVATCGEPALSLVRCSATGQGTSKKYSEIVNSALGLAAGPERWRRGKPAPLSPGSPSADWAQRSSAGGEGRGGEGPVRGVRGLGPLYLDTWKYLRGN